MEFLNKIINFFNFSYNDRHLWNVRIGENKYRIQDILSNYENLIGNTQSEAINFFREYTLFQKNSTELIYEVQKTKKGIYLIILHFYQEKLTKVNYSYLEYKITEK